MASTAPQQHEPIDVENYESTAESSPEDGFCDITHDDITSCDVITGCDAGAGNGVCCDNVDCEDDGGCRPMRHRGDGYHGHVGRYHGEYRHGDGNHGDWWNHRQARRMWKRQRGCGRGDCNIRDCDQSFRAGCPQMAGRQGVFKSWKKGMKEVKKHVKKEMKRGGKHGQCKHAKKNTTFKHTSKDDLKDDIFIYMGDFMANEISVTLTDGKVKVTGNHDSGESFCRPHSVVHTYAAPVGVDRRLIKAVLFPKGVLQVRFLEPTEVPVEIPVGDDVTVATDAIAELNVDKEDCLRRTIEHRL